MATALGQRYLDRYTANTCTIEQLEAALTREWISQDEFATAIAPDGTMA